MWAVTLRGSLATTRRAAVAAVAARRAYSNKMEMFQKRLAAERVGRQFDVSGDQLRDIMRRMWPAAERGSCWDTHVEYPPAAGTTTPVPRFLSLDINNTELAHVRLTDVGGGGGGDAVRSSTYPVAEVAQRSVACSGHGLFDWVACCAAKFADRQGVRADGLPLAFTFGFPVRQTALDEAVLCRCTKRLACQDTVGRDVVTELRLALSRAGICVGPVVLFNDACAALLDGAADHPGVRVSLLVDEGCNCCYASIGDTAIVNTEWGAFGESGQLDCVLTRYDRSLDARSRNPGQQIFEKLTSGMYMAELVRKMVTDMTDKNALFGGQFTRQMFAEHRLRVEHLCRAESDARGTYAGGRAVLTDALGACHPSDFDCELFRYACECVTKRSAHLIAAGLAGLLIRHFRPSGTGDCAPPTAVTVAVAGAVFEAHPKYAAMVACKARELTGGRVPFTLRPADRGERGACVVAGILAGMP